VPSNVSTNPKGSQRELVQHTLPPASPKQLVSTTPAPQAPTKIRPQSIAMSHASKHFESSIQGLCKIWAKISKIFYNNTPWLRRKSGPPDANHLAHCSGKSHTIALDRHLRVPLHSIGYFVARHHLAFGVVSIKIMTHTQLFSESAQSADSSSMLIGCGFRILPM
jgi:hypothetical protein